MKQKMNFLIGFVAIAVVGSCKFMIWYFILESEL